MKKNLIGLLILLALGAIAMYVYQQRGSGTIKPDLYDFAEKDTAEITKIFLADKMGQTVLLERVGPKEWTVNTNHKARKDAIDVLLKTINRVEMKAPVANSAHDNIVKLLAGKSTKVEIYKGDDKVKTYYVGDATKDNQGTYMLLEGSRTPFICHIPGFIGYLTGRYMVRPLEWRDSEIFNYSLPEISEIKVEFHQEPERSFKITHSKDRVVQLYRLFPKEELVEKMDTVFVKRYMLNYRNVRFEGIQPYDAARVDSIVNSPAYFTISVTDPSGETETVTAYRLPANPGDVDTDGVQLEWDGDRMHGVINGNEDEIALIQYFTFDRLTVPIQSLQVDPTLRRDN
ncbi:MAG: DUF4340 domain-containing protein [Flavobacteriales bacterium]|nr:DUF4340 domain-containing protein [Flavobacteriales bacterium]